MNDPGKRKASSHMLYVANWSLWPVYEGMSAVHPSIFASAKYALCLSTHVSIVDRLTLTSGKCPNNSIASYFLPNEEGTPGCLVDLFLSGCARVLTWAEYLVSSINPPASAGGPPFFCICLHVESSCTHKGLNSAVFSVCCQLSLHEAD